MAEATLIARIRARGAEITRKALATLIVEIRKLQRITSRGFAGVAGEVRDLADALGQAGRAARTANRSFLSGGGILGRFRAALLDAFLIKGVIQGFVQSVLTAARAIGTLVGSAAKANIELTGTEIKLKAATKTTTEFVEANLEAARVARLYGLDLQGLKTGLADLLASSKSSNLLFEEQLRIFNSLTQASRVFNLSSEQVKLAILAISQISSKGVVALEELKRQLGDQIPGVVPGLAKALGITVAELFKRTRANAISAEEGIRGLADALDEMTAEQAVVASRTLAAELGRLQTEIDLVRIGFAGAADEGLREAAEAARGTARDVQALAVTLGGLGGEAASASAGIARYAGNLALVTDQVIRLIDAGQSASGLGFLISPLEQLEGLLTTVLPPLGIFNTLVAAMGDRIREVRADKLVAELSQLTDEIERGSQELTSAYQDGAAGVQRAVEDILRIQRQVVEENLSEIEVRRQLRHIVRGASDEQLIALEKERIKQQRLKEELQERMKVARQAALAQLDGERSVQDAIESTTETARSQGRLREEIGADLVRRLVEFEVTASDDIQAELKRRTADYQADSDKREEIEKDFSKRVEQIRRDLNKKILEIREEHAEKLLEEGGKEEEINKESLEKQIEARREANEKIAGLLEDTTDKVAKEARKQTQEIEKEAEKAADAFERLLDKVRSRDARQQVSTEVDDEDVVTFGEALAQLEKKLADLETARSEAFARGEDVSQLNDQILVLRNNIVQLAQQGIPTFREQAVSGIGAVSDEGAALIDQIEKLRDENDAFRQSYQNLGEEGKLAVDSILRTFISLGENTRITESDLENFRSQLQQAGIDLNDLAPSAESAVEKTRQLGAAASEAAASEKQLAAAAAQVAQNAQIPEAALESLTALRDRLTEVHPVLEPVVEPLTKFSASFTALAASLPILPEPLKTVVAQLIELHQAEVLDPLSKGLALIVAQTKPLSETLPPSAEALQGFNKAAGESEQPLGVLETALKKIAEKELLARLERLSQLLNQVNGELVNLDTEGFGKAEAAAARLKETLTGDDGLLAALKEFGDYLRNEFSKILSEHAADWNGPIDAVGTYSRDLRDLQTSILPGVATAGEEMAARLVAAFAPVKADLREIINLLNEIDRRRDPFA